MKLLPFDQRQGNAAPLLRSARNSAASRSVTSMYFVDDSLGIASYVIASLTFTPLVCDVGVPDELGVLSFAW